MDRNETIGAQSPGDTPGAPPGVAVAGEAVEALIAGSERIELRAGDSLPGGENVLYVVLDGLLEVVARGAEGAEQVIGLARPGEFAGLQAGAAAVRALRQGEVAKLSPAAAAQLRTRPAELLPGLAQIIAQRLRRRELLSRLSSLFGSLDEAALRDIEGHAEWLELVRGEVLMRESEPGDSFYLVLSGRLQAVLEREDGSLRLLNAIGPGESIGEIALLTQEPRSATVYAIRDSVLLRFPAREFEYLLTHYPTLLRSITRIQSERLRRAGSTRKSAVVASIAVVPLAPEVPLAEFTERLVRALAATGSTLRLSSREVDERLGTPGIAQVAEDDPQDTWLLSWLSEQEDHHRFLVFEADATPTSWSRRSVRQADQVLLVGMANGDPRRSATDQAVLPPERTLGQARRHLVLLHPDASRLPSGTRRWLAARHVEEHHHLRWDSDADFARLARAVTGRAIGLVLGGGGARGFAHIGVVRALQEADFPIDMIGGTSMGAAMAAQYAMGWSPEKMLQVNRRVWIELAPHKEYTLPLLSVVGNRGATRCGQMMYGEAQIEDLWVPYFCVSSSLTRGTAVIHREGPLLTAVTASSSIPGFALPVLHKGELLVDGGLLDNLPDGVMRELGGRRVIVSNVSVKEDEEFLCERVPAVREVLWSRLRRGASPVRFPSLMEVVLRSALLASIKREAEAMRDADLWFRPPIERFSLMDFSALDDIAAVGYEHARERLQAWRESQILTELEVI